MPPLNPIAEQKVIYEIHELYKNKQKYLDELVEKLEASGFDYLIQEDGAIVRLKHGVFHRYAAFFFFFLPIDYFPLIAYENYLEMKLAEELNLVFAYKNHYGITFTNPAIEELFPSKKAYLMNNQYVYHDFYCASSNCLEGELGRRKAILCERLHEERSYPPRERYPFTVYKSKVKHKNYFPVGFN